MSTIRAVRTYLELPSGTAFVPAFSADPALTVVRPAAPDVALFRRLYHDVGKPWHWTDRNAWSDEQLAQHLSRAEVELWVLRRGAEDAGFFELERGVEGVRIVYFGLDPRFFGLGLGKHMLSCAIREARRSRQERVFLDTCTLDGPAALPNYLARGFSPYRVEEVEARRA